MRRVVTIGAILLVSCLAAIATSPPDPFSYLMHAAAIFPVAILSYVVGLRQGRRSRS